MLLVNRGVGFMLALKVGSDGAVGIGCVGCVRHVTGYDTDREVGIFG